MKGSRTFLSCLILMAVCTAAGCCRPKKIESLNMNLIPQHRDWWCWAATTEMISTFYGHAVEQCQSANNVHGTPPDCCTGCTGNCPCWGWAWGASITDIQNNWTHWKFTYTYAASSLSWADLTKTLSSSPACTRSPIQVVWWWTGGGGHVVAAYGFAEAGGQRYVSYNNPLPPDCSKSGTQCTPVSGGEDAVMTYDAFVSDTGHNWGNSFYNFKYVP